MDEQKEYQEKQRPKPIKDWHYYVLALLQFVSFFLLFNTPLEGSPYYVDIIWKAIGGTCLYVMLKLLKKWIVNGTININDKLY